MKKIVLKNIRKKYPGSENYSVKEFNLEIEEGEFIVFVGPSGCGKSTTLRMIAGLEDITEGELWIDGELANDKSSKDRDIAMVFQSYALYPHMSVEENIGYGLKLRKYDKGEIKKAVAKVSQDLGLNEYLERKPKNLSGGQRQRVALGRAMVRKPKLFLMDEPLSNLDAKLRTTTRTEISRLHREKGVVTIYVTHDQVEAMTMADRIVVMSMGEVQQIGTPKELYTNPINKFVATFMGQPPMNTIKGIYKDGIFTCEGFSIALTEADCKILNESGYNGKEIILGVRSQAICDGGIYKEAYPDSVITIKPVNVEYLGDSLSIFFEPEPGNLFVSSIPPRNEVEVDKPYELVIEKTKLYFFDVETEKSIKYHINERSNS